MRQPLDRDGSLAVLRDKVGTRSTEGIVRVCMKLGARCGAAVAAKGQQHDPWLIARLGAQAVANGQHVVVQAVQGRVGLLTNVAEASVVHGFGDFLIHHRPFHVEVARMARQLHTRMRRHLERSCARLEEAT